MLTIVPWPTIKCRLTLPWWVTDCLDPFRSSLTGKEYDPLGDETLYVFQWSSVFSALLFVSEEYLWSTFEVPNFSLICLIEDLSRSSTTVSSREILLPPFPANELCHDCLLLCPQCELSQPSSNPATILESYRTTN